MTSEKHCREIKCEKCGGDMRRADRPGTGQNAVCLECGGELTDYREYAVKLGSPVGALKPKKSGVKNNEYFKIEAFRDMPAGKYFVEPKYDGVWMEAHKKDGKVVGMYTDEGNDHATKFFGVVKELEGLAADNFIIVGEMTRWRGGKRLTHDDVTSWIHGKQESYDDKEFKYKPFDQVMSANEDVSGKSLEDRRKILDTEIKYGKQVHPTAKAVVNHKLGDGKLIYAINDRKTREGSMVKDVDGRYSKEDSDMIWKWKSQYSLDSKVTEVEKKAGGGNVYTCSIGRGKDEQVIGDTFSTSIEANKGDVIEVSVDLVF
jgi:ATP-dependent DNA ligase